MELKKELKKRTIVYVLTSVSYLLFLALWGYIGNMFGWFTSIENFGIYGLTVGLVLAIGLGIELGSYVSKELTDRVKILK